MTLTNAAILKLHVGLSSLDGQRVSKDEVKFYDFEDDVSWNITQNQVIMERAVELFDKEKKKRARENSVVEGMPLTEANAKQAAAYMDSVDALKDQTQVLDGLIPLKRSELKQKKNKIPPSVMKDLFPLLEE